MSKQFSLKREHHWDVSFWLIFDSTGGVRLTRGVPALGRNERALNLKMSLPLALFEAPSLSASTKVEQPTQAVHIDVDAIAEAVRGAVGMDIDIHVQRPSE